MRRWIMIVLTALIGLSQLGCSRDFWGGAAAGAVGAGAGYELKARQEMKQLEEDYEEGKITREEYEQRKKQIEKGSIAY